MRVVRCFLWNSTSAKHFACRVECPEKKKGKPVYSLFTPKSSVLLYISYEKNMIPLLSSEGKCILTIYEVKWQTGITVHIMNNELFIHLSIKDHYTAAHKTSHIRTPARVA